MCARRNISQSTTRRPPPPPKGSGPEIENISALFPEDDVFPGDDKHVDIARAATADFERAFQATFDGGVKHDPAAAVRVLFQDTAGPIRGSHETAQRSDA